LECLIAFQFGLLLSGLNNCFTDVLAIQPDQFVKLYIFRDIIAQQTPGQIQFIENSFLYGYHCDFFCSELRVHSAVVFRILSGLPFDEFHPGTILYILYTVVSQEKTCCLLEVISRPIL
jgi:hypothetical protein